MRKYALVREHYSICLKHAIAEKISGSLRSQTRFRQVAHELYLSGALNCSITCFDFVTTGQWLNYRPSQHKKVRAQHQNLPVWMSGWYFLKALRSHDLSHFSDALKRRDMVISWEV